MNTTIQPKATDATLDKMRRKSKALAQIFNVIDPLIISERIEILEEILDALDEVNPDAEEQG